MRRVLGHDCGNTMFLSEGRNGCAYDLCVWLEWAVLVRGWNGLSLVAGMVCCYSWLGWLCLLWSEGRKVCIVICFSWWTECLYAGECQTLVFRHPCHLVFILISTYIVLAQGSIWKNNPSILLPCTSCQSFGFSAMTYAHVGYITKFLWGQRRPPENSEIELINPFKISISIPKSFQHITHPKFSIF